MSTGSESFSIANILRKTDDTVKKCSNGVPALKSSDVGTCHSHRPPSDKERTKDNSSTNSGSTNLSPPQAASYGSESSVESPALKFSMESMIAPSLDIQRNSLNLFLLNETIQSQRQFTLPWLSLPPVSSGFYQGGFNTSTSTHLPSPTTPNEDECGEIIEYSPQDFGSASIPEIRPKRARITFSPHQVKFLRAKYNRKKYLSNAERSELARELNLSEQQVKIWFQNQRYKEKKRLDKEKENTFSQTNFTLPPRLRQLSPPSPLWPSHSEFLINQRGGHPSSPFSYPPPPLPFSQLVAQMILRAYSHAAPHDGVISSPNQSEQSGLEKDRPISFQS